MTDSTTPTNPTQQLQEASHRLQELYRQMNADAASERRAELEALSADEVRFAASQWTMMWRRFRRNRAAIIGGVIVLIYYLVALIGGFMAPYGLTQRFTKHAYMPPTQIHLFDEGQFRPFIYGIETTRDASLNLVFEETEEKYPVRFFARGEPYEILGLIETDIHLFGLEGDAPNPLALLGTDRQGRDMLSRIILGSQVSLTVGLFGVLLSLFLGTILGIISGYYGGWVDEIIQRLIEIVRAFPSIPLWMALSAALPSGWNVVQTYFAVTVILSLIGWTWLARQLRGQVLAIRNSDYVMAAKLVGASDRRIIVRHLIPATIGQIIVVATLSLPAMIIAETSLSFLGLGLRPPITSWGVLLQEAQNLQSIALYPWVFTPAIFIVILILAFSFMGDGLRDAADPYTN